jgi:tetratricopeptide (TPR) repeat protein
LLHHPTTAQARLAAFLNYPGMAEHVRMNEARAIAPPVLAWAEAELGHDAQAAERLEAAIAWATAQSWHLYLADALRIKGILAAKQQRWEDARAVLDEAITSCRAMPYPYAEAKALYVYGQQYAATGEPEQARTQYQAALSICQRLGEGHYRPHIERAMAALGPRRPTNAMPRKSAR